MPNCQSKVLLTRRWRHRCAILEEFLVKFLGRSERRLKILEMSPGNIGGFSVGSTLPETQLMGRAPKRKRCHLPTIDFQDPFGVGFRGVTVMIDFFLRPPAKRNRTRFFPGQLVTRERHLIERANHYSACSLCVKFDHLPQARVENTTQKTSDLSSKLT